MSKTTTRRAPKPAPEPVAPQSLGARIAAERKRRGIPREQAAREMEFSPPRIRSWELGFSNPHADAVPVIERWLAGGAK